MHGEKQRGGLPLTRKPYSASAPDRFTKTEVTLNSAFLRPSRTR
jgi:hypothetical protein